ncbi:hypothetical protein BDN72DRAFT_966081 [Pluteus cervinus]|uniref:Uncharacterized protein n=1 Tax=Pluteus cervinus TaxID=181527 RepID=A0ACD3A173_9AGAR|nr:hypothetical protein BDN72DRAFT_966081 [Pluteus cervinus]
MSGTSVVFDGLTSANVGGVEVGTLLALLIHGSLITQFISYYKRYPQDSIVLKLVVATIGLASLAHVVCIIWALYDISVKSLNDPSKPFAMPITFPVGLCFTSLLQFLVQLTYAYRMYKFSQNWIVPIFVFIGVAYNIVGSGAFARGFPLTSFDDQQKYEKSIFWLVNSMFINTAVNDVVITVSMCYYLRKGRDDVLKRTAKVIERLVMWTIQTSAPTCVLGFAVVATFRNSGSNTIWIGLSILATPVYPAALLALLNGRESLARGAHTSTDTALYSTNVRSVSVYNSSQAHQLPSTASMPPVGMEFAHAPLDIQFAHAHAV